MMNLSASESLGCRFIPHCVTINFIWKKESKYYQINFTDTNQLFTPPNPYNH